MLSEGDTKLLAVPIDDAETWPLCSIVMMGTIVKNDNLKVFVTPGPHPMMGIHANSALSLPLCVQTQRGIGAISAISTIITILQNIIEVISLFNFSMLKASILVYTQVI